MKGGKKTMLVFVTPRALIKFAFFFLVLLELSFSCFRPRLSLRRHIFLRFALCCSAPLLVLYFAAAMWLYLLA
jgi:hypothetical protein